MHSTTHSLRGRHRATSEPGPAGFALLADAGREEATPPGAASAAGTGPHPDREQDQPSEQGAPFVDRGPPLPELADGVRVTVLLQGPGVALALWEAPQASAGDWTVTAERHDGAVVSEFRSHLGHTGGWLRWAGERAPERTRFRPPSGPPIVVALPPSDQGPTSDSDAVGAIGENERWVERSRGNGWAQVGEHEPVGTAHAGSVSQPLRAGSHSLAGRGVVA